MGLVIDEELGIVDCFSQRSVLVPKLCKVQPGGGEDKPRIPDGMIAVRVVECWQKCATGVREELNGHTVGFIVGSRQETVHKDSHGSDGSVLTRCIVDVVPSEGKVCRKQGNVLRFACTVHLSHHQLSLAREEGEEYFGGRGERVEVTTLGQRVGRQPVRAQR